eukprot:TRINITY_DN937_c0_g1_i1.p2 TRINITY_DN937_c0_g1~~TRINITY_DN937_c0_g1_i1.p2  ORF type:complete len:183 (+),score=82.58 TRINITY_DN937_c0_g1_i1:63-611(+)
MFACCAAPAPEAEVVQVDQANLDQDRKAEEERAALAAAAAAKAAEDEKAKKAAEEAQQKQAEEEAAKTAEADAAAKKAEEEAAAKKAAEEKPVEYTIELVLDKEKMPIGLELKQPSCVVKSIRDGLLAAKYNASAAEQKIQVGDKLISFNGSDQCVSSIKEAYQKGAEGTKMSLKFSRPASK